MQRRRALTTIQILESAKTLGQIATDAGSGMALVGMLTKQTAMVLPEDLMWYQYTPSLRLSDVSSSASSALPL